MTQRQQTKTRKAKTQATPKPAVKIPTSFTFQAPEFIYYKKGVAWAMVTSIIAGLIILDLVLAQKYFLIVIIVVGLGVFIKYSLEKPQKVKVKLDSKGIKIKNHFYPWGAFISFGLIRSQTRHTRVYFNYPGIISLPLSVEIPPSVKIKTSDLQKFLRQRLPEKFIQRTSIFDAINQYLRF